jgi:protein ATS1
MTFALLAAGSNGQGQLGIGTVEDTSSFKKCGFVPPDTIHDDSAVVALATGANHTLLLLRHSARRAVYSSGTNERGQLGPSPTSTAFVPLDLDALVSSLSDDHLPPSLKPCRQSLCDLYFANDVGASWETSFIHLRPYDPTLPDLIVSFGANDWGELGRTGASSRSIVDFSGVCTDLNRLRIKKLAAGPRHVVALIEGQDGNDFCAGWGAARHGQLGSSAPAKFLPVPSRLSLPSPSLDLRPSSVSVGRDHTVIHLASIHESTLVCLGSSKKHQLGVAPPSARHTVIRAAELGSDILHSACSWNSTFAILQSSLLSWGSNSSGQLGRPCSASFSVDSPGEVDLHGRRIDKLACGSEHAIALVGRDDDGGERYVMGWGWNEHGNLGRGDREDVWEPCEIYEATGVVDIFAGNGTSWLVIEGEGDAA